jgi:hypothetical protein
VTDDNERLERVLRGFEEAIIDASDEELGVPTDGAAKVISGVLKVYGFENDGTKMPTSWKRVRRPRSRTAGRSPVTASRGETPLRATFSGDRHDEDDDGPEDSES